MKKTVWTTFEDRLLLLLRRDEKKSWAFIEQAFPRRTGAALINHFYKLLARPPKPAPLPVAVHQAAATKPSGRQVSTHVLIADAELRSRIALQGLTAGLFGDPLPGRSALDQRNAGDLGSAPRIDRRISGPKPTLSQGG
jgi:hypothetical protein